MSTETGNISYDEYLLAAVEMASGAGRIMREYFRSSSLTEKAKINDADIVTPADKACDALITGEIRRRYPDHSILAEESGEADSGSDYRWVIDPIDGTTNFAAGVPICCTSIALEYKGETIVGVVYDPFTDELFTAVKGQGAMLNGHPVRVKTNDMLSHAVVSTGFPIDKDTNPDNNIDVTARVLPHVRGLRRLGSSAMDICYVAAGVLDAYWEMNLHAWDVAAALLILHEAGGVHSSYRNDRNISIVVSSEALYSKIEPLINQ
ncbi:MAG: inositol monophosphatase [Barnesiella sp.]|nr:inositol monophosphatase [Barnesiella sp.]